MSAASRPAELRWLRRAGMCRLELVLPHRGAFPRKIDDSGVRLDAKFSPSAASALACLSLVSSGPGLEHMKMLRDLS